MAIVAYSNGDDITTERLPEQLDIHIDLANSEWENALTCASLREHVETMLLLIHEGAETMQTNNESDSALIRGA